MRDMTNDPVIGILSEEIDSFVCENSRYFEPIFKKFFALERGGDFFLRRGVFVFNWGAFFLSLLGPFPLYFIYRKMYKVSGVFFVLCIFFTTVSVTKICPPVGYIYSAFYSIISLFLANYLYYLRFKKYRMGLRLAGAERCCCGVTYLLPAVCFVLFVVVSFVVDVCMVWLMRDLT